MGTQVITMITRDLIENGPSSVDDIHDRLCHYRDCPSKKALAIVMNRRDMFVVVGWKKVPQSTVVSHGMINLWDINREHPEIIEMLVSGDV